MAGCVTSPMWQGSESVGSSINRLPIKINQTSTTLLSNIKSLQVNSMMSKGGS